MNAAAKPVWRDPAMRPLVIGLVNNMGLSSMAAAKAQFAGLLATTGRATKLLCFTMRAPGDGLHDHLPIDAITDYPIDAIIVTGMEVTTSDLREEWIWQGFTRLHDWAEQEALPAIWSCLAAHAAVLHRDGIARQPIGAKLSGVFDCQHDSTAHRLTNGLPKRWRCPHSRYNGLSGEALVAHGYSVISHGEDVGVDIFTRGDDPASFYFQGHPEYQAGTLLQEFLRDLRRYLAGETFICPSVPAFYLDNPAEVAFLALRAQALAGHDVMPAARALARQVAFRQGWAGGAARLYANWLDIVAEHISRRSVWTAAMDQAAPAGAALS